MIFGSKLVGLFFSIDTQNATTWNRSNSQSDESTWPIALLGYLEMKLMWARNVRPTFKLVQVGIASREKQLAKKN